MSASVEYQLRRAELNGSNFMINLLNGDCLEQMKQLDDNSVDSIVTDPPYGISFMAKKWDYDVPSVEVWKEAMRVLKPGGHALIACGTRTQHRMVVNIEDAGFEIRDVVSWIYGSGFPKSLNIGKAIDKRNGKPEPTKEFKQFLKDGKTTSGLRSSDIDVALGFQNSAVFSPHYVGNNSQVEYPTKEKYKLLKELLSLSDCFDHLIEWAEAQREVVGSKTTNKTVYQAIGEQNTSGEIDITAPATESAKQWDGWGTALKPSCEFFTLCRKPLSEKTIAANVLKWGTGGINIDGCRVELDGDYKSKPNGRPSQTGLGDNYNPSEANQPDTQGRFPANLIHDGSQEVLELFPETKPRESAARFFYQPKASKKDRDEGMECEERECGVKNDSGRGFSEGDPYKKVLRKNNHPTVKPTALMAYLCRLITPTGGTVLDPYMGSGSTGKAAVSEGFSFTGIELDPDYYEICKERVKRF